MLPEHYEILRPELETFIPTNRLVSDPLRTLAYGTDAGFYRLTPKLVVEVENEVEMAQCLRLAAKCGTPVTFRATGASLSRQDSKTLDTHRYL